MKIYRFKMQWLWNIAFHKEEKDMFKMLALIGPRSLTRITFLNYDFKPVKGINHYMDMVMHTDQNAYSAFRKYWNKLKKNPKFEKVIYVEFYRE